MRPAAADGFTQLALHLLAHVPRAGPGDLFAPEHLARCEPLFRRSTQALLRDDAATLAALWRASPALDLLDGLPELHASLPAFRRSASRALAELDAGDVASPELLHALQRLGAPAELVHATLALVLDEFERVHDAEIAPALHAAATTIGPALAALAEHAPGLAEARVELVWSLGTRGRAMPGRILIGCPAGDPFTPAVVAAHEHAVCTSGHVDYLRAEWSALVRGARWLRAADEPLRRAHARWLARLDLSALVAEALAAGLLDPADVASLRDERSARAERLASQRP